MSISAGSSDVPEYLMASGILETNANGSDGQMQDLPVNTEDNEVFLIHRIVTRIRSQETGSYEFGAQTRVPDDVDDPGSTVATIQDFGMQGGIYERQTHIRHNTTDGAGLAVNSTPPGDDGTLDPAFPCPYGSVHVHAETSQLGTSNDVQYEYVIIGEVVDVSGDEITRLLRQFPR